SNLLVCSGARRIRFSAEVRSVAAGRNAQAYCGVRLLPQSAADENAWIELLDEQRHASTSTGSRWARATWRLYEKAGYFDLSDKDPAQFEELFGAFESVGRRLDDAPELGCQAVWAEKDGELAAAMSMMKTYSAAWLVFQLAKITGPTRAGAPS